MNKPQTGFKSLYFHVFFILFIGGIISSCSSDSSEDPPLPSSSSVVEPSSSSLSSSSVGSSSSVDASSSSVADNSSSSVVVDNSSSSIETPKCSNGEEYNVTTEFCLEGVKTSRCGTKTYTAEQFCDTRGYKLYKKVTIGNQTWMAENLNFNATGSKCYGEGGQAWDYDENDYVTLTSSEIQANCTKYGRLYDWSTAMDGAVSSTDNPSGVRGVCPEGWHLPSMDEWDELGDNATVLKATTGWNTGSGYIPGTNTSGFSALPGGFGGSGVFFDAGSYGYWWSSTEYGGNYAYFRGMYYCANAYWGSGDKSILLSVRCVQD